MPSHYAKYTDAWRRTQGREPDPQLGVLAVTDPEHDVPGIEDPNPNWSAEVYPAVNPTSFMPGFDNGPKPVSLMDKTSATNHERGGLFSAHNTRSELAGVHSVSQGADVREGYDHNSTRFHHERFMGDTFLGSNAPAIDAATSLPYVRGLNSNPVNNGPSGRDRPGRSNVQWEKGRYHITNIFRDFRPKPRTLDYRFVAPNVVTRVGNAPPPREPDTYSSPFPSLQRFIVSLQQRPIMRRSPAPYDEEQVTDATVASVGGSFGYESWG